MRQSINVRSVQIQGCWLQEAKTPHSRSGICGRRNYLQVSRPRVYDGTHEYKALTISIDLPGHQDEVYAVDWSPDGQKVGSGGKDKAVRIWRH